MALFKKPRTVVPGIDGVPYSLLQGKFYQGEMPNLVYMEDKIS